MHIFYCDILGEFDHVDYKGKQTKCRSACEDQVLLWKFSRLKTINSNFEIG